MKGVTHTDPNGTEFALKLMTYLRDTCNRWAKETNIDFSLYGTPLESTTYKFAKNLQKRFGKIKGVTDKNYITNSYHVHVTENINAFDKLKFEAQFQELSPGGFTDCMLQNGAVKVYAVDVGYGQFAWKLRQDERVVCMEKTNIRYVKPEDIADRLDFASVDVSFISLTKVLGPARELLNDNGEMVCLIKPQFEAGREKVGKKGVVRDKAVHEEVIHKVIDHAVEIGFHILNLEYSPIKGPEGNIEYLVYIRKEAEGSREESVDVHAVVEAAHGELDK
jgi:hypothetical protein